MDTTKHYKKLVISGGELKGFIMLGSLQYIYDNYDTSLITHYIGTSVGSIISYLLAIGYTPIELVVHVCTSRILSKFKEIDLIQLTNGEGAYNWTVVQEYIEQLTIQKIGKLINLKQLYEEYGKHVTFVTTNYTKQETEYISVDNHPDMPCLIALRMSSSIPIVFPHFYYLDSFYIDGGISNNFPINLITDEDEDVLAIYCSLEKHLQPSEMNVVSYTYSLLFVPIKFNMKANIKLKENCDNIEIICLTAKNLKKDLLYMNNQQILDSFSGGYQKIKEIKENNLKN